MIALVTSVLEDLIVPPWHRDGDGKRSREHRRVGDRVLIVDEAVADAREAFDGVRVLGPIVAESCLIVEIRGVHDQRLALPMASGVAIPVAESFIEVRT